MKKETIDHNMSIRSIFLKPLDLIERYAKKRTPLENQRRIFRDYLRIQFAEKESDVVLDFRHHSRDREIERAVCV